MRIEKFTTTYRRQKLPNVRPSTPTIGMNLQFKTMELNLFSNLIDSICIQDGPRRVWTLEQRFFYSIFLKYFTENYLHRKRH